MESPSKDLSFLHYNHCYGLQARTLSQYLCAHIPHFVSQTERMRIFSKIEPTIDLIRRADADVVSLCEVFGETQRTEIMHVLQDAGYTSVHFGQGHRLGKSNEHVEAILATKMKSSAVNFDPPDVPPLWGHGGGIVAADIPDMQTRVISAHLAHPIERSKDSFERQVTLVHDLFDTQKTQAPDRCVMAVDSNCNRKALPADMQKLDYYADPKECTYRITACGVPIIRWKIDHMLGRGFDLCETEMIDGPSDHRAVFSKLRLL